MEREGTRPDLADRPHRADVEHELAASAHAIYAAWTIGFDTWFATPGTVAMRAEVGAPFYFAVLHEGTLHPHYGRFLSLDPDRRVELTWVTGAGGTNGAETVLRIDLVPVADGGTLLTLAHGGFATASAAAAAQDAWPHVLAHLDDSLTPSAG